MRNLFLSLALANMLLLAWQFWVDPSVPVSATGASLAVYGEGKAPASPVRDSAAAAVVPPGTCLQLGPLPDAAAARQASRSLLDLGVAATPVSRETQVWLGHWVQIAGFDSVPSAEGARARLIAAGIADALLIQDGPEPILSLGVFRDRNRADRIAGEAQKLGFSVVIRERYRAGVEQWILVKPRPGQVLSPGGLDLPGPRILRAEPVPCGDYAGAPGPADSGLAAAGGGE